jgi:PAS domain S-box-containing protein
MGSQYSRNLIEAILDPLFAINTDGKIMDMNNAMLQATNLPRTELINSDFFNHFTEPEKARQAQMELFKIGFINNFALSIKDHKETPVLCNGSVYRNNTDEIIGAVIIARDITEQKKTAAELNEAKIFAELATEFAETAKIKAENATRIAEDAVKAKQQFLSNMSHEIRTPMNAIIGFTKVILKTELSAKQFEYLEAIKTSGDSLIVLINDILDLAKVDSGKMTFEKTPFKMALSLSAMLHVFDTKIKEKNLELDVSYDKNIPEVLSGDPVRLHQIILNLISNAVKFTSKGKINVTVKLIDEDDDFVNIEFKVSDTGIGIHEDKLEKIFENFQQATSGTSRLYGGTGLGLAIVEQLVTNQGGTIVVKSTVDVGSDFSIFLRFEKTNSEAEVTVDILEKDTNNLNISVLVVEDIALNQLLMKTLLDDFGFGCDIAANGEIAIEKLKINTYDMILMDLQMPVMNGFEATEFIRKNLNLKTPIIALTADVTTADVTKCIAVGMQDYISKPVDEKLLYNKIIGLVKKTKLNKKTKPEEIELLAKKSYVNLEYLNQRTKSNPTLMMEMISLYLEQTPPLILIMNASLLAHDWELLQSAVHKMIPSFAIMGMSSDFEEMAKKIKDFAHLRVEDEKISELVSKLGEACSQACVELEEEFLKIKQNLV